ncbi:uncharacterized protein F5147DRAFT_776092 [Suillus discolor]|uniref:Glycosyltransferase 2-like domain-containing protein n=1 Tax=Suillus discolor TaxID=1912936 RepID=A0A9P7F1G2_9AGAM|nr:uncharacterized protein F5147DRAFT_776092 [Suillus discolor]KAG2103102.1 hypothetical protein F5147DRAFT_776092 [Suillus discolor]
MDQSVYSLIALAISLPCVSDNFNTNIWSFVFTLRRTLSSSHLARPLEKTYRSRKSLKDPLSLPSLANAASIDLSVIIPAYNKTSRLRSMLETTLDHLNSTSIRQARTYELIIIDDDSKDNTSALARLLERANLRWRDRRDLPMDRREPLTKDRRDPHAHPMERLDRPRPPSERGPIPAGPSILQLHLGPIHPHLHTHVLRLERDRERERERKCERERFHAIAPPLDCEREMTIHRDREVLCERAERLRLQQQQQWDRDRDRERERPGEMQPDKPSPSCISTLLTPYALANTHTHTHLSPHAHNTHGHPSSHGHVHIPPPPPPHNSHIQQGCGGMLPVQGQFQALPPPHLHEWDRDREHMQSQRVDRERVYLRLPGPERERHRDIDRDREQRERLSTDQRLSERPGPGEILQLRDRFCRKRRWCSFDNIPLNGKTKIDPENLEKLQKMHARTLVFGDSGTGAGFKYTPIFLACTLFPHLTDPAVRASLPRKQRKIW